MEYKVKKGVSKEPLLWGMKIPQFIVFISILIISAFILVSGLTVKKILLVTIMLGGAYFILQLLSKTNVIKAFFSDHFPDTVKNDLLK